MAVAPFALDLADAGPAPPIAFGLLQRDDRHRSTAAPARRTGHRLSTKGMRSPLRSVKSRHRMHVLAMQLGAGAEGEQMRPRHGRHGAGGRRRRHPGNGHAIIEADRQFGAHVDMAGDAFDDAHDGSVRRARRHEVDHPGRAGGGGEQWFPGSGCRRDSAAAGAWTVLWPPARSASGHCPWCPEARRNRRRNRNAARTASRSSHCGRPAPRCGNRRSWHNLQCALSSEAVALVFLARRRLVHQPQHLALRLEPAGRTRRRRPAPGPAHRAWPRR